MFRLEYPPWDSPSDPNTCGGMPRASSSACSRPTSGSSTSVSAAVGWADDAELFAPLVLDAPKLRPCARPTPAIGSAPGALDDAAAGGSAVAARIGLPSLLAAASVCGIACDVDGRFCCCDMENADSSVVDEKKLDARDLLEETAPLAAAFTAFC